MMQVAQIQVLDTIEGSSVAHIREALQHVSHDQDAKTYAVRVFDNGKPAVVFAPKNDNVRMIGVRDGIVLSPAEVTHITAHSRQKHALQAGSLAIILAALPTFEQRKMNLADYRITLLRNKSSYVLTFTDNDSQSSGRGNPGKRLGLEVELSMSDLHVIRSHFIR